MVLTIGAANIINGPGVVWTNGQSYADMRQNERLIYSRIDVLLSYMAAEGADTEAIANVIAVYYIDLQLIREFGNNRDLLYKSGSVLSCYVDELLEMSPADRAEKIVSLIDTIKQKTINGNAPIGNLKFMSEFETDICGNNYYIDFRTGQRTPVAPKATIGSTQSQNFLNEFKKVSANLVYTRCDYSQMSTREARLKYARQVDVISELCASGYGFTGEICANLIDSQIMATWGNDPDTYVSAMRQYTVDNREKIGVGDVALIVSLVTAAIGAGVTIFTTIYRSRHSDTADSATSALYNARSSYADFPDWLSIGDIDGDGTDDTLKVYGLGALALLGLWFFGKKK